MGLLLIIVSVTPANYLGLSLESICTNQSNWFARCFRDEEDENVKSFPVVHESAGRLLETGINTLQKTLLLKKEVEVYKI